MARIKIEFPGTILFSSQIPVRIGDINYGGHLGNDAVLSIIHEARMQFLASLGQTEKDLFGAGIIMTDAVLSYQSEMFYGDTIEASVASGETGGTYFELYYRLVCRGKTAVVAKTGFVCFDYESRKVQRVPETLLQALRK